MKIGIVRHFKVLMEYPTGRLAADDVMAWFKAYDEAEVQPVDTDLGGINWTRCFASDLPRAVKTAQSIYTGEITYTDKLREIAIHPIWQTSWRLPIWLWVVSYRIAWFTGHKSQKATKLQVKRRVAEIVDTVVHDSEQDTLIVCHAMLMVYLRKELIKRGFRGPRFGEAENGKLYVFEK